MATNAIRNERKGCEMRCVGLGGVLFVLALVLTVCPVPPPWQTRADGVSETFPVNS